MQVLALTDIFSTVCRPEFSRGATVLHATNACVGLGEIAFGEKKPRQIPISNIYSSCFVQLLSTKNANSEKHLATNILTVIKLVQ